MKLYATIGLFFLVNLFTVAPRYLNADTGPEAVCWLFLELIYAIIIAFCIEGIVKNIKEAK